MKHRLEKAIVTVIALAGLAIALRQDLASLTLSRGDGRLRVGDLTEAETAYRQAVSFGSDASPLAFNLGVSLYRQGKYVQAQKWFTDSLAAAGPKLVASAHYNRGNSLFRQAERLAAGDKQAADKLFRAAIADYRTSLAGSPTASDAGNNLILAEARLAALGNKDAQVAGMPKPGAEQLQQQGNTNGSGQKGGKDQAQRSASREKADSRAAQRSDRADPSAHSGKSRPDLTQTEAERLLNDARGREKLAGMLHGGSHNGPLPKPDRDW